MRRFSGPLSRAFAVAACAGLLSSGALAAAPKPTGPKTVPITIPLSYQPAAPAWSPSDERYEAHRRWSRHRHNGGIDGGDLLAGVLVLGGIAAIASAIGKSGDEQRERTSGSDYPERPYDYRGDEQGAGNDWRGDSSGQDRYAAARQDRAVKACSAEASRSGQVDEIFEVEQADGEWHVRGDFQDGGEFTCTIDRNGRAYVGLDGSSDSDGRRDY